MIIRSITFEEILPSWTQLWPERQSPIEPTSNMTLFGGLRNFSTSQVDFIAGFEEDRIVAVNSIHQAESEFVCRSRGLWVDPNWRNQGFGILILEASIDLAKSRGYKMAWTFPRQSSFFTYAAAEFVRVGPWIMDGEFGPNAYAVKLL